MADMPTLITTGTDNTGYPVSKNQWNNLVTLVLSLAQTTLPSPTENFPKLGAFYPNSTADAVRFDYIVGNDANLDQSAIRAINPDIVILEGYDSSYEVALSTITADVLPYQWLLTQVGTTLNEALDASETTIDVTATVQGTTTLFYVGQNVLIEGDETYDPEVVRVVTVNATSLEVVRGVAYGASAHGTGVRVAALVQSYGTAPFTYCTMDITDQCPAVDVGGSRGAETFVQYHTREAIARVTSADYDGLFFDLMGGNYSRYVGSTTYKVYSIDYARDDTLATEYDTFDAAWSAGLVDIATTLKAGIGTNRYFLTNAQHDSYDNINGSLFEAFPRDATAFTWQGTMFGPRDQPYIRVVGSVKDWLDNAETPNLTALHNTLTSPTNTEAEFQTMRFCLASALVGGVFLNVHPGGSGYVAHEWFDEYDNAGAGTGYLGAPITAAFRVQADGTNLLADSEMDSSGDIAAWTLSTHSGVTAAMTYDSGMKLACTVTDATSDTDWGPKVYKAIGTTLTSGVSYLLRFEVKSDAPVHGFWRLSGGVTPTITRSWFHDTEWTQYEVSVVATGAHDTIDFYFGIDLGNVWFRNVQLMTGNNMLYRRDFEHGITLVNSGAATVSDIPLGGTYAHIDGDDFVGTPNDGTEVTTVTLASEDGIIMLNT